MSRYTFAGRAGVTVTVGWDRPLSTFFVHVTRPDPQDHDESVTILWEGTAPQELPTAASVIAIASEHAELPPDLGATLETDRLKTLGSQDGPAQVDFKRFRFGSEK